MKQTLEQRLRVLESKVAKKKRLKERAEDESLEEYFEGGTTILPHRLKSWENNESYIDYIVEHQISFIPNKILEIHVTIEVDSFLQNPYEIGWPVIEEVNGKIKLSSAYGARIEDYIICDQAIVDTSNAI